MKFASLPGVLTVAVAGLLLLITNGTRGEDSKDKPDKKPQIARRVHYTGNVQGVGFRATAVDIARDFPVTGWVKNLADGRVELLVEGPEDAVEKFLDKVRTRWKKNIDKEQVEKQEVSGKYKTFDIAF
jgi:acylphosphatase